MPTEKLNKAQQEMLAKLGIELKPEDFVEKPIEQEQSTHERNTWEAQSTLLSLQWPYPDLVRKVCIECGKKFATNYHSTVWCSNECVKKGLEKNGIKWRPDKTFAEQWGVMEPPLIIPPEAIRAMRRVLNLIDSETPNQSYNQEQDYDEVLDEADDASPDLPTPDIAVETPKEREIDPDFLSMLDALED